MFEHGGVSLPGGADKRIHLTMEVEILRPAEVVWPYLVDWERLDRWMLEGRGFRVIGDRRAGVGVEAEATIRMLGFTMRDRIRVTRWEPPAVLEIEHLGRVKGSGFMELGPTAGGSRLFWRETLDPPLGRLGRSAFRIFRRAFRNAFQRDLWLLKDLVERGT